MHTPELWPAVRDWHSAVEGRDAEAQARAYRDLRQPLLRTVEEHRLRDKGQVGRCNAGEAIYAYYASRPHEVRPLLECPACRLCHTDSVAALRLAAERIQACWGDRTAAAAQGEAEWAAVAVLVVDGLPESVRQWCDAHADERPADCATPAERGNS
jgi:hypothetical protein